MFKIVDLFAGPGGLGEGFSSHEEFQIAVSAEMESSAHATLRLRAFYRKLKRLGTAATKPYFDICNGNTAAPQTHIPLAEWDLQTRDAWKHACEEALQLTLGDSECNARLDQAIKGHEIGPNMPWVLIGGPPCQAYSLVGRSRNKGKVDYTPEGDPRHFLYREYLRIIDQYKPSIFVMENVKGILSSKVDGQLIFHSILKDLAGCGYRIHSLVTNTNFTQNDDPTKIDARDFIVRAEQYGVPQARHRVILLGIREDVFTSKDPKWRPPVLTPAMDPVSVKNVINDLPQLRSKVSKGEDSAERWKKLLVKHAFELAKESKSKKHQLYGVADELDKIGPESLTPNDTGLNKNLYRPELKCPDELATWYTDGASQHLNFFMNHEARGHMESDLRRYLFASAFAKANDVSPKGHTDFVLRDLAPAHENWESGKFSDRFRVQVESQPATTVTSHIAKDGHYFIHYDPFQCRSLTVREAARLQTFPDDYYFQGNRTQQFHQVGNAVPSFLAFKIGEIVLNILLGNSRQKPSKLC